MRSEKQIRTRLHSVMQRKEELEGKELRLRQSKVKPAVMIELDGCRTDLARLQPILTTLEWTLEEER